MTMIQQSQITSNIPGQASLITSTEIMQRQMIIHCLQHHLRLWHHCLLWAHLRNPLPLNIAEKTRALSTNSKNISNSLLKILTLVIQFIGGWVNAAIPKPLSFGSWHSMHSWWVILILIIIILFMNQTWDRLCCCCWEDLLWWTGHDLPPSHQSPCRYHLYSDACKEAVASCTHACWYCTGPLSCWLV